MLKFIMKLLIFLSFFSCKRNVLTYYEYNGVVITRIDKEAASFFYYGKCDGKKIKCSASFIKGNFSGRDGYMLGYLVFQKDEKVKMVYGESLNQIGKDTSLFLFRNKRNYEFIDWHDSIKGNYNNVVQISNLLNNEKQMNLENHSKVKVIYIK